MRLVVQTDQGVLELNWLWLPTFIGINNTIRREMGVVLSDRFKGRAMTDEVLDEAHSAIRDFLVSRYPAIIGLDTVLDSLKSVELKDERRTPTSETG